MKVIAARTILLTFYLGLGLAATGEETFGTIEGTVKYEGEVPKSKSADDAGRYRDLLEVETKTRGLLHVVVYLDGEAFPTNTPTEGRTRSAAALVNQQDHTFVPHLTAVRAGQTVTFTNSDPANHNVRASSPAHENEFNVFTGSEGSYQHRFVADAKQRPVRLTCDIHPWMSAWVFVFDHPHFAVTDQEGKFRISPAPPGRHRLVIEQPDVRYRREQMVTVKPGDKTVVAVRGDQKELKAP